MPPCHHADADAFRDELFAAADTPMPDAAISLLSLMLFALRRHHLLRHAGCFGWLPPSSRLSFARCFLLYNIYYADITLFILALPR